MRTIEMASESVSGKATELLPLPPERGSLPVPRCPVNLSAKVSDKNFCEYRGYYHTDYTLPSEYFQPDVERPAGVCPHTLDFTYLFHRDVDNPDFRLMGEGHQIRSVPGRDEAVARDDQEAALLKQQRGDAEEVLIDEHRRLIDALKVRP